MLHMHPRGAEKTALYCRALTSLRSPMCWHVVPAASPRPSVLPRAFGEDLHLASLPLCLFQWISALIHTPLIAQNLPLKSLRLESFSEGNNEPDAFPVSLFVLHPWVSPEDREPFVLHGVPLQKGACEQSILPLGTTSNWFFCFHLPS